ncbi:NAD(P)-binding domain-containing protein [Cohnella kolymensis]|uniref:NAD(P)-binding domain-containing protein n=1 Tax=Cohnella kolymensis TaxID=1590652 RepID=UPI0009E50A40|nr:NAD(P)-binding domain-containing protein [Cohnella kolymensis]
MNSLPIAIIGGGPVGMAAAAHLAQRQQPFILLEKGDSVGASVWKWRHVRLFSAWEFNVDRAAAELLTQSGWQFPDKNVLPTGEALITEYLLPLSRLPQIKPFIITGADVKSIHRKDMDKMKTLGRDSVPFEIVFETSGEMRRIEASAIIDSTGTWNTPNPIGASGDFAEGEQQLSAHVYYGIQDTSNAQDGRYVGKSIAVVGSGHSAINTILELHQLQLLNPDTEIHWILRKSASETYGGGEADDLPARGELGQRVKTLVEQGKVRVHTPFLVQKLQQAGNQVSLIGTLNGVEYTLPGIDEIVVNTGARPDFTFLRELRYQADPALESVPALADLIDPNIHSCGTVRPHGEFELRQPEKNLYIVGSKSYGRAPTFLMATGYEQVRSVAAALAGDWNAARQVELKLPETGVCKVGGPASDSSCCGIPVQIQLKTKSTCC